MENKNTILVVGQAKPSKEDAIYNLHGEFYISLIVERDTGKILELDCNTILGVTKQFVASMFVGKSLRTDVPLIEKEIRERYFALTQKPLIACMKDACNRYLTAIGENRGKLLYRCGNKRIEFLTLLSRSSSPVVFFSFFKRPIDNQKNHDKVRKVVFLIPHTKRQRI